MKDRFKGEGNGAMPASRENVGPARVRVRSRNGRGRAGNYFGFVRVPGLFRMWEIQDLVTDQSDLQVEPSGTTDDGTPVYVVFRREGRRS